MKSPGRIEPAGAYKFNSAVSLVSPPIELPDQRGSDRLDKRPHVFGKRTPSRQDGQVGAIEARVSIFGAPEETRRQLPTKESRQPDLVAAANEPTVIGVRVDRAEQVAVEGVGKVDLIKAGFSVAAIPVREHIRSDQIANPSADSPGTLFFLFAGDAEEGNVEILVQVHEVVVGERADDPIAPEAAAAELVVAAAAHPAEPTAAARCGFGCDLLPEEFGGMIDVPQAITGAAINIAAGKGRRRRSRRRDVCRGFAPQIGCYRGSSRQHHQPYCREQQLFHRSNPLFFSEVY